MSKSYEPRMHTAEHLLNRAMVNKFGCGRCFSAHINKNKSKCDYHFDRPLTPEEIRDLESEVNAQIRKDLEVRTEHLPREKAGKTLNLSKVPDIDLQEEIRVVSIGDYDSCPCIGSHVATTDEIGSFVITTSGYEAGVLRIRFRLK